MKNWVSFLPKIDIFTKAFKIFSDKSRLISDLWITSLPC